MPTTSDLNNPQALERLLLGSRPATTIASRAQHNRFPDPGSKYPRLDPSTIFTTADLNAPLETSRFSGPQPNVGASWMAGTLADELNLDNCQAYRIYRASEVPGDQAGSGLSDENPSWAYRASGFTRPGKRAGRRLSGENRSKDSKRLSAFPLSGRSNVS